MTALKDLYNTDHQALVAWVCREYGIGNDVGLASGNPHRVRRETIATRLRLYRDESQIPLSQVIDSIYETEEMRRTLKQYIQVSKGQNVYRRIVNEVASLYDRPALRLLKDSTADAQFHEEERRLSLHFIHQEAHRLTNLCNETLIWQFAGVDDKPTLRIVTPDLFDAIPDPRDKLVAAGYLIDFTPISTLPNASYLPHYEIWDDTYRYRINKMGGMVDAAGQAVGAPEAHGLGRIPGVLLHRRHPTVSILDASYGEDIKSAHLAVQLLDVMIMRLSKSQGERQPVLSGNLAAMATGQVMNGERPLMLPPEVTAAMLEMKTDPDHYIKVKREVVASVAQTYGMSYEQFTRQDAGEAQSGKAYQVRREKLTELRMEQRARAVMHETQVVELMGFDPTGMRVDFQEQAIPQDATEKVSLLREKMKLGLDSPISFMMREDPDLTREMAKQLLMENIRDYAGLIAWVRAINAPMGGDVENAGKTPEENGLAGAQAKKMQPTDPNEMPTKDLPSAPLDGDPRKPSYAD